MELLSTLLQELISSIELIMFLLIIGGGVFLLIQSRGKPLLFIKSASKLLFNKERGAGISRFQALSAVLASTVGLGNISGVAIAIYMGGPGVLLWMWATAILGAIIKFYSCTLAVLFREKEEDGSPLGGPMYYMRIAVPLYGKTFAVWFSIAGLFGVLPAFTANQLTQTIVTVIEPNQYLNLGILNWKLIIGVVLAVLSGLVILGGLKKIVTVTSMLVPLMVGLYFSMGIIMLALNAEAIIPAFQKIFDQAFSFQAVANGSFWALLILGVRRAVFSNESGVGNAPMYHGQSNTKNPIDEGLVASLGPLLDTVLVCSITGLIIIISGATEVGELNGIELTLEAFKRLFYGIGDELLLLMVFVFGISSLFTYSYYGVKCLRYLTQISWGNWYNYIYIISIVFFAIATVDLVIGIIDLSFALMAIPNMISLLWLSKKVKKLLFAN